MRSIILIIIVIVVVCFSSPGAKSNAPVTVDGAPLVLISIDGLKPDYIFAADKYHLKIPNFRRIIEEGAYATGVKGVLPTLTYPSHTTMLTGVAPARHGIISNTPFDPMNKNLGGWYWYADDIKVPTLWDAAAEAGLTTASVDWPVSVNANITYNIVQYWRASNADDLKLIRALSTKGLLAAAEKSLGLSYPEGYDYSLAADYRRTLFSIYLLEQKRPQLLTCYLASLDTIQHEDGPESANTFAALEDIDKMIGQLRTAAEKLGEGRARICIVSDHGFLSADREINLNAAFQQAGLIQLDESGKLKNWQACAWYAGGSVAIMLKDPADNQIRNKVRHLLKELSADSNNGIYQVLEAEKLAAAGGFPGAAFVVGARPGFRFGRNLQGNLINKRSPAGVHGYLPEIKDMNAVFFLSGAGIAKRNLGEIDMRDIAPTLAGLLNLPLPTAEGHNLLKSN